MLIKIYAKPNSRINQAKYLNGILEVKIKAKPKDGEANQAIIKYLSEILFIPSSRIEIQKGQTSKHKLFEINLDENQLMDKLTKL